MSSIKLIQIHTRISNELPISPLYRVGSIPDPRAAPYSIPIGYAADVINKDNLLGLTASGGRALTPSGTSYGALVVPSMPYVSPVLLRKLLELAEANVLIILPSTTSYIGAIGDATNSSSSAEVQALGQLLVKNTTGSVYIGLAAQTALSLRGIDADFSYTTASPGAGLVFRRE